MTESQKLQVEEAVEKAFNSLEMKGKIYEFREVFNAGSNLKSVFHDMINIKDDDKVYIPINKR